MTRGKPLSFDREQVLGKAMDLFWRKGFKNTSLTELLDHMGVQRQSFYNTFGCKEDIFIEAVERYSQENHSVMLEILEAPGNPLDNIRRFFLMKQDEPDGQGSCGCMIGNTIAEFGLDNERIRKLLRDKVHQLESFFLKALTRAKYEGYLSASKDPKVIAKSLIVLLQGLALLSRIEYSETMMEDAITSMDALFTG